MAIIGRYGSSRHLKFESLEDRLVLDSTVVFNELMYHPAGDGEPLEFIELHNQMAVDMDVSGWSLSDGVGFSFPKETIVPGGGYVVIAEDPVFLSESTGFESALGPFEGRLSNGGERIELRDHNNRLMDSVEYDDRIDWPVVPDGSGASLAKINEDTLSERPSNWSSSIIVGGTPGRANFQASGDISMRHGVPNDVDQASCGIDQDEVSFAHSLVINEVAAASDEPFWIEFANVGSRTVDSSGYFVITSDGHELLPLNSPLEPGQIQVVQFGEIDFPIRQGDRLFLFSPSRRCVVDGVMVSSELQGRSSGGMGPFHRPILPTPGARNQFQFHDEIVINEIMYHAPSTPSEEGAAPTFQSTHLIEFGGQWRHSKEFTFGADDAPLDPGLNWDDVAHEVDNVNWFVGSAPFGFSTSRLPERIEKSFPDPRIVTNYITTYYFEAQFSLSPEQIDDVDQLHIRHMVDDGAVFYLNGKEVHRINMPEGIATAGTLASSDVADVKIREGIVIETDRLVALPQVNRFSVEVHQSSTMSDDIVFAAELLAQKLIDPGRPAREFVESDDEWIELYNRGEEAVDISGWTLSDAVTYQFPEGTSLLPDHYLLVARDAALMRDGYPELASMTVGPFDGSLSNRHDRILLSDSRGNPADIVEYFENGNWPEVADGGGASLELRDPFADNASSIAWDASVTSGESPWRDYAYEGIADRSAIGPDGQWHELVMGMLDSGVVLLDDIRVVEDPHGQPRQLIQNGSFGADEIGNEADKWRIIGNHRHSSIVRDPDDASNQVLRLVATGPTEHMHNHAETTLHDGNQFVNIRNGMEYRISFRAKWLSGSNQLHTRLYFNRLARVTLIERPESMGTPGRRNSTFEENIGPTFGRLHQFPTVPDPDEAVDIRIEARDPHGVSFAGIWYSVNGGPWTNTFMTMDENGLYHGQIPSQQAGDIVQFYIQAWDGSNVSSTFPRSGPQSRTLYQVDDGRAATNGLHNLRIILTPDDARFLHRNVELMSNDRVGATVVYNEREIFHNIGVRLSGSERARTVTARLSFSVAFNTEQLFRGVHRSITLDRSESTGFGQRELLYHHGMNHAGGLPTEYNDLVHIVTPRAAHTGPAEMQLARYSDVFLDSQFENGGDGQLYEYELTYYPTTSVGGDPEGRKLPNPDSVRGVPISNLGDSEEDYRWAFLIKNNRIEDDYSQLMEFAEAFGRRGQDFQTTIGDYIDVDQWLRAFAFSTITGHGDNYGADGAQHNAQFFIRPSDDRVLFFPHDLDAFFNPTRPLVGASDLRRLIAVPEWEHTYYGHVHDMIETTFNASYMERWTDHFGEFLPRQPFDRHLRDLVRRSDYLLSQIERQAPPVPFSIQTDDQSVATNSVAVEGDGWIDVRRIRVAADQRELPIDWTDVTNWRVDIPVRFGVNNITLEAYDFQDNLIATDSVSIESTFPDPASNSLRITELSYNPHDPTVEELISNEAWDNDDFEFIEVRNPSDRTIDLSAIQLTDGVLFQFPSISLEPAAYGVVVKNVEAFQRRYGNASNILGEFESGNLGNAGEFIRVADADGRTIQAFSFSDDWYADTDGVGRSLIVVDPFGNYDDPANWRPSPEPFGSPGSLPEFVPQPGDANFDRQFDQRDIVDILQAGKYADDSAASWSEGDWNGDGRFDQLDVIAALQTAHYQQGPYASFRMPYKKTNFEMALAQLSESGKLRDVTSVYWWLAL